MRKTYDIDLLNLSKTLHKTINQNSNEKIKLSIIQESVAKGLGYSNFNHALKQNKISNEINEKIIKSSNSTKFIQYDEFWKFKNIPKLPDVSIDISKNLEEINVDLTNTKESVFIFTRNEVIFQHIFDLKKQKTIEKLVEKKECFILIDPTRLENSFCNYLELLPDSFSNTYLRYTYSNDHNSQINKLFNNNEYCFSELLKIGLNIHTLSGNKSAFQNQLYLKSQLIINLFKLFYKKDEFLAKFSDCFNLISPFNFYISDLDLVLNIEEVKKQIKGNELHLYLNSLKNKSVDEQSIHNENMKSLLEIRNVISNEFFIILPYLLDKLNIKNTKINTYLFIPK